MSNQTKNTHSASSPIDSLTYSATGQCPDHRTKYRYDPYGRTIGSGGTLVNANVFRFSSKLAMDVSAMNLYYYGYRFYEVGLQRWVNRDPLEEDGGLNLYTYVGNSALNFIDPFGLAEYPSDFVGPLQPTDYRLPPFQPINPSTRDALSKYFGDKNPDHLQNIPDDELSKARDNAGRACEKYKGQGRTPDKFYDLQKERQKLLDDLLRKRQGPQPSPRPPWWMLPFSLPGEIFVPFFLGPAELYTDPDRMA